MVQAIEGQPLKAVNIPWIPEVDPDEVINTVELVAPFIPETFKPNYYNIFPIA